MGFEGFENGLLDNVNSWKLPDHIVRLFCDRIVHDLETETPSTLPRDPNGRLIYRVNVQDPHVTSRFYVFALWLRMTDEAFWIYQVSAFAMDGDEIIWKS